MNLSGPLVDGYGRVHTELRVSVTDRCNLRCYYCMPAEGVAFRPHEEILSYEEIERFVRVAVRLGIRKIRLTGGEPLVRRGVATLVERLAALPDIEDLALTTNGVLLGQYASVLKSAGLHRLNVSLDTLDPEKFSRIARRNELPRVLEGIAAAQQVGFTEIRINALAIRGQSEADIVPLARYAREHGVQLRFIEFMPTDAGRRWSREQVLPGDEILRILTAAFGPLVPIAENHSPRSARQYGFAEGGGQIGLICSVTRPFCGACRRMRLTADGKIRNCLFGAQQWDAKAVLRGGGTQRQLAQLIRVAIGAKAVTRGSDDGQLLPSDRPMHQIGG